MNEHSGNSGQLPDALPPAIEAALDNLLDAHHLAEHFGLGNTIAEYRAREMLRTGIATALREARNPSRSQCYACQVDAVMVDETETGAWGIAKNPDAVTVQYPVVFCRCPQCGREWYTPWQAQRATTKLLRATIDALYVKLAEARRSALEDAAKAAEDCDYAWEAAEAIRALATPTPERDSDA